MQRSFHLVRLLAALFCAVGSVFAYYLFFTLYWPYRALFDEQGRYFDEGTFTVYHEQSGLLLIPAVLLMLFAALFGRK